MCLHNSAVCGWRCSREILTASVMYCMDDDDGGGGGGNGFNAG